MFTTRKPSGIDGVELIERKRRIPRVHDAIGTTLAVQARRTHANVVGRNDQPENLPQVHDPASGGNGRYSTVMATTALYGATNTVNVAVLLMTEPAVLVATTV